MAAMTTSSNTTGNVPGSDDYPADYTKIGFDLLKLSYLDPQTFRQEMQQLLDFCSGRTGLDDLACLGDGRYQSWAASQPGEVIDERRKQAKRYVRMLLKNFHQDSPLTVLDN